MWKIVEKVPGTQPLLAKPLKVIPLSPDTYAKISGEAHDPETGITYARTGRFFTTLSSLGLLTYDFREKQVLNIANGESRLPQFLNFLYGKTGTVATALDLFTRPPFPAWGCVFRHSQNLSLSGGGGSPRTASR